jgi:choline-sulfatase
VLLQQRRLVVLIFCLVAAPSAGCKNNSPEAAASASTSGASREPAAKISRRTQLQSYRPLIDEVGRAELDVGGVLIDLGSPDQHKYTRGGWRTGWGASGAKEHETWISLRSRQGFLELPAPASPPTEIVVRARSKVGKQRLSWHVAGRELGAFAVGSDWSVSRVPLPAGALPAHGRVRLELRAAAGGDAPSRADIDWVWLARGDEQAPALTPRVLSLDIAGNARRSLAAPTARTYALYVQPPPQAELVVDLGAADRTRFTVTAVTDDGKRIELANEIVEKAWRERAVSLAALAGKAVRLELTTSEQRGAAGWGEPELMVAAAKASRVAQGGKAPKNLILLVIDTARADAFGPFAGPDRVVKTPHFDALAARSTVFASAYNNENWTKPSVATLLSGLYPTTHDAKQDADMLSSDVELLSEHLKRAGFATAGFVANGYVSRAFGFEQGWDVFRNYIRERRPSETEHVFGDALAWHEKHVAKHPEQPFFLYLQTIDPHVTYRVDREFWAPYFDGTYDGPLGQSIEAADQVALSKGTLKATKRDVQWLQALYWGEIAYHDAQLGKLLAELEARRVLDDTLLVITNDHGEELGERGRYGHGHQVFEEMIRAPLVIHYPPLFASGAVISDVVEHVDVAPTILDVLGQEPLRTADGISFLPLVRGLPTQQPHYAMSEFLQGRRVLRAGPWKLFGKPGGGGALFDLAADPSEQHDLGDGAPVARQLCEILLGEALAIPAKAERLVGISSRRRFQAGEAKISPQMRRQLEALGYLGADPKAAKESDED